ncbi:MAG TPA: S8 family serine peptidase, partial [Ignavibacteria bacterium]|nr:S8 family serine peptidase [Ignavibacteria bacterium]
WALGNRGAGVLVGNADDGFHCRHPDVVNNMYQNLGEDANNNGRTINIGSGTTSAFDPGDINGVDDDGNGKIDDFIGWDFSTNNYNITTASHGTATLSTVVGDGTMGNQTGVAPEAKSIVMRNSSGQTQQWAAFQYALQMGCDVMTSSLSWKWNPATGNPSPPDYSQFRTVCDMSLAGGMIHTNSTSNDGGAVNTTRPIPVNISTAGNVPAPWVHPDQLHVGGVSGTIGVGNVLVSTDVIYSTSPYGPSTWGNWSLWGTYPYSIDPNHRDYPYSRTAPVEVPDSMGLIKPDVSAPGQNSLAVYVSSGTGYGSLFGGTSSATPHTAGCIALMLSINPEMLPQDVAKVIMLTAVEKGDPGKDNRYGAGRIDALAATTSPKFTLEGINNGSNMLINNTLAASDTARELVGFKISTSVNPQVGSLRNMTFGMTTNASGSDITSFDLYYDADNSNTVSSGDVKLQSIPFTNGPLEFTDLKFKYTNNVRQIILAAKTTGSASGSQNVNIGLMDTAQVSAYYTTRPFITNFPFGSVTGVSNNTEILSYQLSQNYPNPFNPETLIKYSVAKDGFVKISVFDMVGRQVGVLVNGMKTAGNYQVEFDANFYGGLSSGVYYYKIEAGDFSDIKKMILLK